jgi:hypothetical protein
MRLLLTLGDLALEMRGRGGRAESGPKPPAARRARAVLIVLYIDRICVFRLILFRMANGRLASQAPRLHEPMGRV